MSVMKKGSRGEDVALLQTNLNALGYPCGKVDGIYGDNTVAAVLAFQKKYGLVEDGKAGPVTLAAIQKALGNTAAPVKPENPGGMVASELDVLIARVGDAERELAAIREALDRLITGGEE